MGKTDRIIRGIAGLGLLIAALFVDSDGWRWAIIIIGAIILGTSLSGFCPLYLPFHISTKK